MPKESIRNQKIRISQIIKILKDEYPESKCSLNYKNPFQLLVATILSAQCTDERVNRVTSKLFAKYDSPIDFSKLTIKQIGREIFSTGFYNNKAKSIKGMSEMLIKDYNSIVPSNIDDLVKLPGVGRKTANVVLGNYFNIPGLVVDTHVTRISNILKITKSNNAVIIERELNKIVDVNDWVIFTHLIIDHGRAVCIANRPKCQDCVISNYCPSFK